MLQKSYPSFDCNMGSTILKITVYFVSVFLGPLAELLLKSSKMYPTYPNYSLPYPVNPAPSTLTNPLNSYSIGNAQSNHSSNPLDGVIFKLSPALELSSSSHLDSLLDDVKRTLERVKNLLDSSDFTYDGSLERNFLRDNRDEG